MIVANRKNAWRIATLCTVTSVVGGIVGYYIGAGLYETIGAWIVSSYGLEESFKNLQSDFMEWG
ncbi:MAG: DedA family protein, partial [Caedimonadaceae bacterium]